MSSVPNSQESACFGLRVEGMACQGCAERVEQAIRATPGVASAMVSLEAKRAEVTFSGAPRIEAVIAAIGKAGYEAVAESRAL